MKLKNTSLPKKMLLGLPFVWLGTALFHGAGGKAAMLLWLLICPLLPRPHYPYPRKSRIHLYRLFFAWSGGCLPMRLFSVVSPSHFLVPGISALGVMLCAFLYRKALDRRSCLLLSMLFVTAGM
ncbi:MAG: hypothetical protein IKJ51_01005 [Clostridia bacterium]|nr:hypothetical protein [Clostridia bacterium]